MWWSAAGTGERSPILFDGALVNAASSVLPMVRFPPCSFQDFSLPSTEFFAFLLTGGNGGPFPFPTITTKPLSLSVCVYVCVVCASLAPVRRLSPASRPQ